MPSSVGAEAMKDKRPTRPPCCQEAVSHVFPVGLATCGLVRGLSPLNSSLLPGLLAVNWPHLLGTLAHAGDPGAYGGFWGFCCSSCGEERRGHCIRHR